MMAGSTNIDAVNVQIFTNLVLGGGGAHFSPNGFGHVYYLGCFQSQSESSLERLPVSYCKLHVHLLPL